MDFNSKKYYGFFYMHKNLYYATYLHILQHVSASSTRETLVLFN